MRACVLHDAFLSYIAHWARGTRAFDYLGTHALIPILTLAPIQNFALTRIWYIHIFIYIYIHIHIYTIYILSLSVSLSIYTYICIYIYIYIYSIYIFRSSVRAHGAYIGAYIAMVRHTTYSNHLWHKTFKANMTRHIRMRCHTTHSNGV